MVNDSQDIERAMTVYRDATETIRHYDKERMSFAQLNAPVIIALFTTLGADQQIVAREIILVSVILLATLALVWSLKLTALIERERGRAAFAGKFDAEATDLIGKAATKGRERAAQRYPLIAPIPVQNIWTAFYVVIVVGAFALYFFNR